MSTSTTSPSSLTDWTRTLCERDMPIFSKTAQNVYKTMADEKKGASELAAVVLQDPALTAKLLKISNTPFYNPSRQKLGTVTRAIVILGINCIRELTLACSFFESVLPQQNKQYASEEIAKAIHAALQAKSLAGAVRDPSPEEVFVATLLHSIGDIAFWCFCGEEGSRISALIKTGQPAAQAQRQVLGFTLDELSCALAQTWHLSGLIEEALTKPDTPRAQLVKLGHDMAEAIKTRGWQSDKLDVCIEKIAKMTGEPYLTIQDKLQNNTNLAVKIAQQFGAHDASEIIYQWAHPQEALTEHGVPDIEDTESQVAEINQQHLQFQILQDIALMLNGAIDINQLLETVLEGIHRTLDMDRTVFLLLTPDKQKLREKFALGWRKLYFEQKVVFTPSATPPNLFYHALQQAEGLWAKPEQLPALYTAQVCNVIGKNECLLLPVTSEGRSIGLIYADRIYSRLPFTQEDFHAARHFVQQANIGLALYRAQKPMTPRH